MQSSPDKKCGQAGRMGASSQGGKLRAGKQRERANEQAKNASKLTRRLRASRQEYASKQIGKEGANKLGNCELASKKYCEQADKKL